MIHRYLATLFILSLLAACGARDETSSEAAMEAQEQLRAQSEAFAGLSVGALRADASAGGLSEQLFHAHCATCHGAGARGKQGVTDLVAGVFNYGSDEDAIRATITHGRESVMPPMGGQYGEMDVGQVVAWVQSLSSDEPLTRFVERGGELFAEDCAVCHGPDGLGMPEVGAPNLTDDYWLHGGSMMSIRLVVSRGVQAQCPPHAGSLTETEINLLTAFVTARRDESASSGKSRKPKTADPTPGI